ncbi:hypothetical protein [Aeribacillus pallidus]
MEKDRFPVAKLNEKTVNELKNVEEKFRQETGEEIVLIAYQKRRS